MKTIEDEVIGELRYLTVEFRQAELVTGGMGVISQDAVKRYFIEKRPDLKVKKCGGLKLDSQRGIVTMRIGVVKGSVTATVLDEVSVVDPMTIAPAIDQKLLNPGYDELKNNYDLLVAHNDRLVDTYKELKEKYDALVIAHEKLLKEYAFVEERMVRHDRAVADAAMEIDFSPEATAKLTLDVSPEDSVDLTSDDENETGTNTILTPDIVKRACDQMEVVGPDESKDDNSVEMTGADGSKIEGEKAEDSVRGDRSNEITVADSDEENKNE